MSRIFWLIGASFRLLLLLPPPPPPPPPPPLLLLLLLLLGLERNGPRQLSPRPVGPGAHHLSSPAPRLRSNLSSSSLLILSVVSSLVL